MRVAVFSARPHDKAYLDKANNDQHEMVYFETRLTPTSVGLSAGMDAVCAFVNDDLSADVIQGLSENDVRLIALRSAGFNHVDLTAAETAGIKVCRVPAYSPNAVAEYTASLILALNRKTHRAYNRVREGNFELDGLLGFDLNGKIVGIVGTGNIGVLVAKIMHGFGCHVIATDPVENPECFKHDVEYVPINRLLSESDIIILLCPLTPDTKHLINDAAIAQMKPGVMLINTSRGAVVDAKSLIKGLKAGTIGSVGLDVYEEEEGLFFEDHSGQFISDDTFARLMTFPNVLITGHQAFFTHEALTAISETTISNISSFSSSGAPTFPVTM